MYEDLIRRLREEKPTRRLAEQAADAIEELKGWNNTLSESVAMLTKQIAELSKPKWIPVTERLPETGVDVLVKFPQNMAVASIDIGEWVVNSGDGWCTDINLAGGEKNPTHWMPLPEPPTAEDDTDFYTKGHLHLGYAEEDE